MIHQSHVANNAVVGLQRREGQEAKGTEAVVHWRVFHHTSYTHAHAHAHRRPFNEGEAPHDKHLATTTYPQRQRHCAPSPSSHR